MAQEITGYSDYIAAGSETFDSISFRFYSEERMVHYIIQANPKYSDVVTFDGGEALRIPILTEIETLETLPPWRRTQSIAG